MSKRVTIVLFFFGILLPLTAQRLSLDFFKDKPRSFIKDFYISQYLDSNISAKDADSLIGDVHNMNYRLFYKFADKTDDFSFKRVKYCLKLDAKHYDGKSPDCIAMGLSSYKATKLKPKILSKIADSIKTVYPKLSKKYRLISSRNFEKLMQDSDNLTINTFTTVGGKFRRTYYNYPIPPTKLNSLANKSSFNLMVEKIIRDKNLDKLQHSILKFDSSQLSSESNFLLAINAIKQNKEGIAAIYLKLSAKKAKKQMQKDKALFWQYLITRDKSFLKNIKKSKDINIYTLFAYEKLGIKSKKVYTSIEPKNQKVAFDITDPFAWENFKNRFKKISYDSYAAKKNSALKLNSNRTQPHVAKLIYKFSNDEHYFLKPYFKYLKDLPKNRAALILAIARQESKFIPTAISYSYALGMMQFMPYVAKEIAKKNDFKNFRYEDLFDPKIAYKFANIHLDFLERSLHHPLFIAYAYNGGIGFTKRKILKKDYFIDKKYEPYMSIEMVPNAQARDYGKKVLANFCVYAKLLGLKDISITTLFETLKPPHRMKGF